MKRHRKPAKELRIAVDCLPLDTRRAMLEGVEANRIIVGAYVDAEGGVCPMLAAHRQGGRTSLASFARAWDRYTKAGKGPRPAKERELRTLRTMLEASIALDEFGWRDDLSRVIADYKASKARNAPVAAPAPPEPAKRDTGERDRTKELSGQPGWAWLRPFRRLDAFEQALRDLEEVEREREKTRERELEPV